MNNLIYHPYKQGTLEWLNVRRGKITSSTCAPLLANPSKGRGGLSVGCWTLIYAIASDLITREEIVDEGFSTHATRRGQRLEPFARQAYEEKTFTPVVEVGFCEVEGRMAGFSADLISETANAGGEIKCLERKAHLAFLETGKVDKAHIAQVNWNIFCGGFDYWDLIHYHPLFPKNNGRLHILTCKPDKAIQERFGEALPLMEKNISEIVEKYNTGSDKDRREVLAAAQSAQPMHA